MTTAPKLQCVTLEGSLILRLGTWQAVLESTSANLQTVIEGDKSILSKIIVSMTAPINPTEVIVC